MPRQPAAVGALTEAARQVASPLLKSSIEDCFADPKNKQIQTCKMKTPVASLSFARLVWGTLSVLALAAAPIRANAQPLEIEIQCSPSTVVFTAVRSGDCFTVHADIPFALVVKGSVILHAPNGSLTPYATFADDCGDLVAKFRMSALKPLLVPGMNRLELNGTAKDPDGLNEIVPFAGVDDVRVRK